MHIVYLDYHSKSVTGGHKYNDAFLEHLQRISGEKIVKTPSCASLYPSWRKIFSPFIELKRLSLFKKESFVFWNDTNYKHHFLLAIASYLFCSIHSIVIIHHFSYLGKKGVSKIFGFALQYFYYSLCKSIIVPSPFTYDMAKKLFPHKNIYYVPLPFEQKFIPSSEYEIGNYLYVGTVDERKGIMYLIDALGIILTKDPNFHFNLNIVGKINDQDYYRKLQNKINNYGIKDCVHFLGRISDEQLEDCYKKAEIFVFPSLLEGYGIVLVEAMSKGLPIVAFNNSAIPYSIRNGENGLLADNKDSQSFADKLMSISGNKEFRHHLQNGMKRTISNLKTQEDFEKGIRDFVYQVMK